MRRPVEEDVVFHTVRIWKNFLRHERRAGAVRKYNGNVVLRGESTI